MYLHNFKCNYTEQRTPPLVAKNTLAHTLELLPTITSSAARQILHGLPQFLLNNMIHIFDMAQIDHEDTLFPIPQVKALLCHVVVVVVVVSAGVLVYEECGGVTLFFFSR